MDEINNTLSTAPAACGGGNQICVAYGNACTYTIENNSSIPLVVNVTSPHIMSEVIQATDLIRSNIIITSGLIIMYEIADCIELLSGFEVKNGAEFTADPTFVSTGACN